MAALERDLEPLSRVSGVDPSTIRSFAGVDELRAALLTDGDLVGMLPFDEVSPGLRTVPVGGIDPMAPRIHACSKAGEATVAAYWGEYPLLVPTGSLPDERDWFDPHELRTVGLSGTSLLENGMTNSPAARAPREATKKLAPFMTRLDVAHVSVENVLRDPCEQDLVRWRFCFSKGWDNALDYLGVDVVELTGNHVRDWGSNSFKETIASYRRRWLDTFGGGENLRRALSPAVVEIRGLKVGFTGVNRLYDDTKGPLDDRPSALTGSEAHMRKALSLARRRSDVFFFTYQGGYEFSATPFNDFLVKARRAVESGALGVVGTHAHMPMGMEIYRGAVVSYGLGNLLFRHAWLDKIADIIAGVIGYGDSFPQSC